VSEPQEIESAILPNLIRSLNEDPAEVSLTQLREIAADQWVSALDGVSLNVRAKEKLAQACADFSGFGSVCRRLLLQTGFGTALANEIRSETNWLALKSMIDKSGLREADTRDEFVRRLGPFLVQRRLLFWGLRVTFSRGTLNALVAMFADREASVRLEALNALETYDISATESDLIYALDDTSEKVRSTALEVLKQRVSPERWGMITAEALEEARGLSDLIASARQQVLGLYQNIPGVGPVLEALRVSAKGARSALESVSDVAGGTATSVAQTAISVRSSLSRKLRKRSERDNIGEK
jgi:hypothetical protein